MSIAAVLHGTLRRTDAGLLARSIGYLALLDLLLLPYFPFFVVPYSLGIMVLWAVCRFEVHVDRELKLFLALAVCVVASAALSVLYRPGALVIENAKRAGQLLTSFAYYFYFRWLARDPRFNPKAVLLAFVIVHLALSVWFLAAPGAATTLMARLYPAVRETADWNSDYGRFQFMFTDPNTNGYLILMVGLYLAQFGNLSSLGWSVVMAMTLVGSIASGSRGVLAALFLVIVVVMMRIRGRVFVRAVSIVPVVLILVPLAVAGFRYWSEQHSERTLTLVDTAAKAHDRLVGREDQTWSDVVYRGDESAGESRIDSYRWMVKNLWPLPLGRGYQIVANGEIFRPHSDFFRMIYSYGFIACALIMFFFFRDAWRNDFAFSALIAFSVNTLLDEQKLLALFLVLLAIARGKRAAFSHVTPAKPRRSFTSSPRPAFGLSTATPKVVGES